MRIAFNQCTESYESVCVFVCLHVCVHVYVLCAGVCARVHACMQLVAAKEEGHSEMSAPANGNQAPSVQETTAKETMAKSRGRKGQ